MSRCSSQGSRGISQGYRRVQGPASMDPTPMLRVLRRKSFCRLYTLLHVRGKTLIGKSGPGT